MNIAWNQVRRSMALAACLCAFAACGDDDDSTPNNPLDGSVGNPDAGIPSIDASLDGAVAPDSGTPPTPSASQYILATGLTVNGVTTGYVKSLTDIDSNTKVDLRNTLEAPGFGDIHVIGTKVWVSTDKAVITRYTINADGTFTRDDTIDFSMYSDAAYMYQQTFASATKAILKGDSNWVVWNPTTLKIEGTIAFPTTITARNGIDPFYAYDRGFVARGNRVYQTVNWIDYTNYKMEPTSSIVVLNLDTNTVQTVLDSTCPGLDLFTKDDAGNLYASGWVWGPASTIVNGSAPGCIVKIPAGSDTIDASFNVKWTDFTGGKEGAAFRHLRGNTFILSVFDDKKVPFVANTTKISEWAEADSWQYATYDIVTKQYKVLSTLPWFSGGYYYQKIGDRFYLQTPGAGYATTSFQQLLPDDTTKPAIYTDGWATRLFQVVR